jgi:hypothetical protein
VERLEAIQGEQRAKHFRHHKNLNCKGAQETALHELGKQILIAHSQLAVPNYGVIDYVNAISEKRLENIRPDVTAIYNREAIYFEIFVSNAVDSGKEKFYKTLKAKSLEIDLSKCEFNSYESIRYNVIDNIKNKKVLYWEEKLKDSRIPAEGKGSWIGRNWKLLLSILALIFLYQQVRRKNRHK